MTAKEDAESGEAREDVQSRDSRGTFLTAQAAQIGKARQEFVEEINQMDHGQYLLEALAARVALPVAEILKEGLVKIEIAEGWNLNVCVKKHDDGYTVVFSSALRRLLYRVTRILATRMHPCGSGEHSAEASEGFEDTTRRIVEVLWWGKTASAVFGPDYPITHDQIEVACLLAHEAEMFLLAHEVAHIFDEGVEGQFDRAAALNHPDIAPTLTASYRSEYVADAMGVRLTMGFGAANPPLGQDAASFRYAGAELALRIVQLIEPGRPPNFPHLWPLENPPPLM
jgi:hypothetical protein